MTYSLEAKLAKVLIISIIYILKTSENLEAECQSLYNLFIIQYIINIFPKNSILKILYNLLNNKILKNRFHFFWSFQYVQEMRNPPWQVQLLSLSRYLSGYLSLPACTWLVSLSVKGRSAEACRREHVETNRRVRGIYFF